MAFIINDPPSFTTNIEQWDRETLADGSEMAKVIEKLLPENATTDFIKDYNKAFSLIYYAKSANGKAVFQAYKKPTVDILIGLKGV